MSARGVEAIGPGAFLLREFVPAAARAGLREAIASVAEAAPFRRYETPGGRLMSVAVTCCGDTGWVSDRRGYRYEDRDPRTGLRWPPMPPGFAALASCAAAEARFPDYRPDSCLVNRYSPGTALSLHQDRDEPDRLAPIVSVSLGLPAVFLWGGLRRTDPVRRFALADGDVAVWGGPSRLAYHGIARLKPPSGLLDDPDCRLNLTFRRATAGA